MGLFETALSWWGSPKRCLQLTHIEGLEHLQAALDKGNGAILLCAHFTTIEMSGWALAVRHAAQYHVSSDSQCGDGIFSNRAIAPAD